MRHLLVTNDFPPKIGGIQSYLWELWRRLPGDEVTVLTTPYGGDRDWDARQGFDVVRSRRKVLLPSRALAREVDALADDVGAGIVILDPALPLGMIAPQLAHPYGVVLHGAEVTVPGRVPGLSHLLGRVLRGASLVIAAGGYPAHEGARAAGCDLPTVVVPPGVDTGRFVPLDDDAIASNRLRFGLDVDADLVVSVSRLVPRKGMDVLIEAAAELSRRFARLQVAIAGKGRDAGRLQRLIDRTGAPVVMLGRVDDEDLPGLYGCADVFAMLCRSRWMGLEQEGFGIVFLEAAACGVAQVAGASGGSHEAVVDGATGSVVPDPRDVAATVDALGRLLADRNLRVSMGTAARARAVGEFTYDALAGRLADAIDTVELRHP